MPTSIPEEVGLLDIAETRCHAVLNCPACRSDKVAQVLGDNGGISYVCTACGHSWS
ncbi:hypothetical protein [Streptomyces sp. URMC 123]|uniref:hypothetical protein n=1 Tax=Streptomyces sp. URMC 123 TaxID=3423403 RepID=UPI003F1DD94B